MKLANQICIQTLPPFSLFMTSFKMLLCSALLLAAAGFLACPGTAQAQSGPFVIPGIRAGGGSDFAYWDLFQNPSGSNSNYNYDNPPALLDGTGMDDDGNLNTAFTNRVNLRQTGTSTCFVTSTGALYSYMARTAFQVVYAPREDRPGEATNVIFQTQSGGAGMELNDIRLVYEKVMPDGVHEVEVPAIYRALDDPQSGAFNQRIISAFQWNLTGLGIRSFKIKFAGPTSLALWQAQLDVVIGEPFVQELGNLLFTRSLPRTRYDRAGWIDKNLPWTKDGRYFFPGDELNLISIPELDWDSVGFIYNGVYTEGWEFPMTFPASDATVTAVFVPLSYDAWRDKIFYHKNNILQTNADDLNEAVSGPYADHDKDGLNNLNEYAAGGDPYTVDTHRTQMQLSLAEEDGVYFQIVRYRINGAPEDYSDVKMKVQTSTDLTHWVDNDTASEPVSEQLSIERQPDGTQLVTARVLQPVGTLPRFFVRVAAVQP